TASAQATTTDSSAAKNTNSPPLEKPAPAVKTRDTTGTPKAHSPRTAAIRSAILPGLGQIYNKKYWKLPIVYGALGVTGYVFVDNIKTYREYRFAYNARFKAANANGNSADSVDYYTLSHFYQTVSPEAIRAARNRFRKYIDYSVLFFVFFWGLNVVDATVDAHLKTFDVSPDLSLYIQPGHSEMANTNGISVVLAVKDKRSVRVLPTFK
ncbi:MAG TPA: DUF5683 domain-containing protein, partial [Chitinophagaceae bacterium]|nr:DUF5683 domain-containing protein [Chitinophagaceae bacterium]